MERLLTQSFDAIVVGTGPGGATVGHEMAAAGLRVLFCERGGNTTGQADFLGEYPEVAEGRDGSVLDGQGDASLLSRAGRCSDTLIDAEKRGRPSFLPLIGSGPGGSSSLYGMAMERLQPEDFEPGDLAEDALASNAVSHWPVSYAEMVPWYCKAEKLYRVRGERDPLLGQRAGISLDHLPPLMPPPPMTEAMEELAGDLRGRGLHPYHLPMACEALPECLTCQAFRCPLECKNDALSISLLPALKDHGAQLLTGCRVLEVLTDGRVTRGVRVLWGSQVHTLQASIVVLAAGALQTPLILLRSESSGGRGLGNGSDQVGRNVMRHFIDLLQFKPSVRNAESFDNRRKEIAFNDLYNDAGIRLGTVQSFGRLPPADMLFGSMIDEVRSYSSASLAGLLPLGRSFLKPVLKRMESSSLSLASIVEDLPYAENRVLPQPGDLSSAIIHYKMSPEALRRVKHMRRRLKELLHGRSFTLLDQASNNQRIAHVCGTCRFGDDPRTSVLDRDNRVHDVDGLFVVDASFFPSSGGTNPSLTIVANALRISEKIIAAR